MSVWNKHFLLKDGTAHAPPTHLTRRGLGIQPRTLTLPSGWCCRLAETTPSASYPHVYDYADNPSLLSTCSTAEVTYRWTEFSHPSVSLVGDFLWSKQKGGFWCTWGAQAPVCSMNTACPRQELLLRPESENEDRRSPAGWAKLWLIPGNSQAQGQETGVAYWLIFCNFCFRLERSALNHQKVGSEKAGQFALSSLVVLGLNPGPHHAWQGPHHGATAWGTFPSCSWEVPLLLGSSLAHGTRSINIR